MGRSLVIIHFQPLELYPPVLNLVDYLNNNYKDAPVLVLSTHSTGVNPLIATGKQIRILRLGRSGKELSAIVRYLNYLYFYTVALLVLIVKKPRAILYYETISSYPAYLYKKYLAAKTELFIHYHEYTSPTEYARGMRLVAYFHRKERQLYNQAVWISHTNEKRMELFREDEGLKGTKNIFILPNYPSRSWMRAAKPVIEFPVKIVYAGALSLDTMYTENFASWVISQNGKFVWDIYSSNITDEAMAFFKGLNASFIRLRDAVAYEKLAEILPGYDVGVILYNGHIPNYVFNAPNKLFEYIACGLDVWYPDVMQGCRPYDTVAMYPKVTALDFNDLNMVDVQELLNKKEFEYNRTGYFFENVLAGLTDKIFTTGGPGGNSQ